MRVELEPLTTIPEIRPGDDLGRLIQQASAQESQAVDETTIVVVAQKIVSKAEGAIVDLRELRPSPLARTWAQEWEKDPRLLELILMQTRRIVRMDRGVIIAETLTGLVCANAGVDQSNVEGPDFATILPKDPDASARLLRSSLGCGAVVITDTFGRPWREGLVDIAIGVSGLEPLEDLRGKRDRSGRELTSTVMAVADQLAAAAGLLMLKQAGWPVVLIRGYSWHMGEGSAQSLLRDPSRDMFR
jgi:coenzyme F420-0:L-glutamate ligase / coenzyme F420-1:gamma-L-glutamate ligase